VLSRRRLIAVSGVLTVAGLTGCTEVRGERGSQQTNADQLTRDRMVAEKTRLLAAYQATAEQHPSLEPLLAEFADRVEAHIEALRSALATTPLASDTSPTSPGSAAEGAGAHTPSVPARRGAALRALAAAEESPAASRRSAVTTAGSGAFAALVASVAACELAHAALLRAEAVR
jgi:hypothetical protein